jgi:hypothetical protein
LKPLIANVRKVGRRKDSFSEPWRRNVKPDQRVLSTRTDVQTTLRFSQTKGWVLETSSKCWWVLA